MSNKEAKEQPALRPCRSPYCECSVGQCSHPGFYDARGEPLPPAPPPECQTDAEKTAFAFGWWKAWESGLQQPAQKQEPVAWNVIDPLGKVVATETNAVRGWARIAGYKPTVEGLLGFHEQGWRVVPTSPQPSQSRSDVKPWVGLTDEEVKHQWVIWRASIPSYAGFAKGIEAKLRELNEHREKNA